MSNKFMRSKLMGGNVLQGYAEFQPAPHPMTLGAEWILAPAESFDELREAATNMLAIIQAAGLPQLASGVELGQTSWLVKATDGVARLRAALDPASPTPKEPDHG